ncbi:MAG: SPOR domain-containing protein [Succinivibrio sp.]
MSISTNLRNRIVGLLVVLSVILILSPLFLTNENSKENPKADDSAIAINQNGAVTDSSGQLVAAAEHDYSEMLEAPVDDLKKDSSDPLSLESNAPKADSPFDALNSTSSANASNERLFTQNALETAVPSNKELTAQNTYEAPAVEESLKTETLHSSKTKKSEQSTLNNRQSDTVAKTSLVSGTFASQMGVFSKKENAQTLLNKLKNSGFKAVTQSVNINGRSVIRVIAGTSKTRAGAEKICKSATAKTGEKCTILSL